MKFPIPKPEPGDVFEATLTSYGRNITRRALVVEVQEGTPNDSTEPWWRAYLATGQGVVPLMTDMPVTGSADWRPVGWIKESGDPSYHPADVRWDGGKWTPLHLDDADSEGEAADEAETSEGGAGGSGLPGAADLAVKPTDLPPPMPGEHHMKYLKRMREAGHGKYGDAFIREAYRLHHRDGNVQSAESVLRASSKE